MPRTLADDIQDALDHKEPPPSEPRKLAARDKPRFGLFTRRRKRVPFTAQPTPSKRDRRGDFMVAALGLTVCAICALFPWYIFMNPDEFGVRAMKFGGNGGAAVNGVVTLRPQPDRIGAPSEAAEIPPVRLDPFSTGTTKEDGSDGHAPAVADQPFPAPPVPFKLVHVANGRAMIEDDSGLFIVQRGSALPDSSTVESIEERNGRWVVVTSTQQVLEIEP